MKTSRTLAGIASLCILSSLPSSAMASCVPPIETGSWVNVNPCTNEITRAVITFECRSGVIDGKYYSSLPYTYVELWSRDYRRDAHWGKVPSWSGGDGWSISLFVYDYAIHRVYYKAYSKDLLKVFIVSQSFDGTNRVWITDNWFFRQ
jgi:hypothetical protein